MSLPRLSALFAALLLSLCLAGGALAADQNASVSAASPTPRQKLADMPEMVLPELPTPTSEAHRLALESWRFAEQARQRVQNERQYYKDVIVDNQAEVDELAAPKDSDLTAEQRMLRKERLEAARKALAVYIELRADYEKHLFAPEIWSSYEALYAKAKAHLDAGSYPESEHDFRKYEDEVMAIRAKGRNYWRAKRSLWALETALQRWEQERLAASPAQKKALQSAESLVKEARKLMAEGDRHLHNWSTSKKSEDVFLEALGKVEEARSSLR